MKKLVTTIIGKRTKKGSKYIVLLVHIESSSIRFLFINYTSYYSFYFFSSFTAWKNIFECTLVKNLSFVQFAPKHMLEKVI